MAVQGIAEALRPRALTRCTVIAVVPSPDKLAAPRPLRRRTPPKLPSHARRLQYRRPKCLVILLTRYPKTIPLFGRPFDHHGPSATDSHDTC